MQGSSADSCPLTLEAGPIQNFGIHNAAWRTLERKINHTLARHSAHIAKHFVRPGNAVGREDHIVEFAKPAWLHDRLHSEAVQCGPSDALIFESVVQCVFVDNAATRCVDEVGTWLHRLHFTTADEAAGFLGQRAVDRYEIARA